MSSKHLLSPHMQIACEIYKANLANIPISGKELKTIFNRDITQDVKTLFDFGIICIAQINGNRTLAISYCVKEILVQMYEEFYDTVKYDEVILPCMKLENDWRTKIKYYHNCISLNNLAIYNTGFIRTTETDIEYFYEGLEEVEEINAIAWYEYWLDKNEIKNSFFKSHLDYCDEILEDFGIKDGTEILYNSQSASKPSNKEIDAMIKYLRAVKRYDA